MPHVILQDDSGRRFTNANDARFRVPSLTRRKGLNKKFFEAVAARLQKEQPPSDVRIEEVDKR